MPYVLTVAQFFCDHGRPSAVGANGSTAGGICQAYGEGTQAGGSLTNPPPGWGYDGSTYYYCPMHAAQITAAGTPSITIPNAAAGVNDEAYIRTLAALI